MLYFGEIKMAASYKSMDVRHFGKNIRITVSVNFKQICGGIFWNLSLSLFCDTGTLLTETVKSVDDYKYYGRFNDLEQIYTFLGYSNHRIAFYVVTSGTL